MPLPLLVPTLWASVVALAVNSFRVVVGTNIGRWAVAVMAYVGISFAVHNVATTGALALVQQFFPSSGPAADWLAFFNVDKAISMIIGAYSTVAFFRGGRVKLSKPGTAVVPVG